MKLWPIETVFDLLETTKTILLFADNLISTWTRITGSCLTSLPLLFAWCRIFLVIIRIRVPNIYTWLGALVGHLPILSFVSICNCSRSPYFRFAISNLPPGLFADLVERTLQSLATNFSPSPRSKSTGTDSAFEKGCNIALCTFCLFTIHVSNDRHENLISPL